MRLLPRHQAACALGAFVLLATLQTWPLARHMSTHLTGPPTGDTAVYVWNTWVFRHELVEQGRSPFRTSSIFALSSEADLSLHNYTLFADVLAVPLQPLLGVVATFNLVYLANIALSGFGMFLLARRLTNRALESWLAGAMFACAPFLVARSTAHFSLVAAAPLPFFMYWLDRTWETRRLRDAAAMGACAAWAFFCDPYYAVYCAMLGICFIGSRLLAVSFGYAQRPAPRTGRALVNAGIVALVGLMVGVHVLGGGSVRVASISISMRSLYTPMLMLTLLVLARIALSLRPRIAWRPPPGTYAMWRAGVVAVFVGALLLAPTLSAVGRRAVEGRLVSAPVLWRSSPPGVDLLAFFAPNPTHPLAPSAIVDWTTRAPGGFAEQVAAVSFVGLAVMVIAWRRAGFRPSRLWLAVTIGFGLLTLGPFIHVAGLNTYLPTPWTFLRYVPIVGSARMPTRFAIVMMLGFCVLFAYALVALTRRFPRSRTAILTAVGVALAVELLPVPRVLYSASVPRIYDVIAADPRPIRVLELPYGVRDGLSSLGDFNAASQYHQTYHRKPIAGGYLSRVSAQRKSAYRRLPVRSALMALSEGNTLSPEQDQRARAGARGFLAAGRIGYVVMDTRRTPPALRTFAIDVLGLRQLAVSDGFELYAPRDGYVSRRVRLQEDRPR